jgi:ABC-type polysaccharide/polyol phosphate export permease
VTVFSAVINFFIAFGIFYVVLLFIKPVSIFLILEYFLIVALMTVFAWGLGMGIGCLNVFLRDFQQITSVIFQL